MRAQGTIEYVVLLAIIVVISLVVISLISGFIDSAPGLTKDNSQLVWSSQDVSIVESVADSKGDAIFKFSNNSADDITIVGVNIDGEDKNLTITKVPVGSDAAISVSNLPACTGNEHGYKINIIYIDQHGLTKIIAGSGEFVVNCTPDVFIDVTSPVVSLVSPSDESVDEDGDVNFVYFVSDDVGVSNCKLIIGGVVDQTDSSAPFDSFSVSFGEEGVYEWNVNCIDGNNNWADSNNGPWSVTYAAPAPPIYFAKGFDGTGNGVFVDSSGNIFVTATYTDSMSFGSINLTATHTDPACDQGAAIAKLDSNGSNWVWANTSYGTNESVVSSRPQVDSSSKIHTCGGFYGSAFFDGVMLQAYEDDVTDIYSATLNSGGNWLWAEQSGRNPYVGSYLFANHGVYGGKCVVDASGNTYLTGTFGPNALFGDTNLLAVEGEDDRDIFVSKLDSDGNWVWARRDGGVSVDGGVSIDIDSSGNLYVTGTFGDSVLFDAFDLNAYDGSVFVGKINTDGNWGWVAQASAGSVYDVVVGESGGVYVLGQFTETATFGSIEISSSDGGKAMFLAKLDSSGNWQWAKVMDSDLLIGMLTYGGGTKSLAVDSSENVYVTYGFAGTLTIGGEEQFGAYGSFDVLVAKFDSSGNLDWAKQGGGADSDYPNGIALDSSGYVYIVGEAWSSDASFDDTNFTSRTGFIWKVRPPE